jgi:Ca-activated chloride channel family protein
MNTNSHAEAAQLTGANGQTAALQSAHVEGRLEGLLLSMKLRQHYRNTGTNNLETVYTFPLPWGTTLLGLNAEIGGHRLHGTVMEKQQATERYEAAIDAGDTPIMVERSARGLYTANLGNLKPGEEAVIEIEYAQLLRFEQGQIRITVPTTVAPRYGDAHATGGLAQHESVQASLLVDYPLTVRITLTGQAARAAVSCPSHAVSLEAQSEMEAGSLAVVLQQGAFLDRDFVLLLQGLQGQSFATIVPDGDQFAFLASFCPTLVDKPQEPLLLKVLVDCSGSMGGDSIQSARSALHEVLKEMEPQDWISYSRFGHKVQHDLPGLRACSTATIREVADLIGRTQADMGGTEMNAALLSTFKHGHSLDWKQFFTRFPAPERATDVLLITDGDIWDVEEVIRSAQSSGHRVFAIGVGSAPAESLLREMAEKTGGACELVSPNQDVAEVIVRMFRRLRATRCIDLRIDWRQAVEWESELPKNLFAGDTLHQYARLSNPPTAVPVLSWVDAVDKDSASRSQACAENMEAGAGDILARLVASAQIGSLFDLKTQAKADQEIRRAQKLELALRYQLVTDQTNLILVHVRSEEDKAEGLPALQKVAHMQAAGWAGAGSVANGVGASDAIAVFRSVSYSRAPQFSNKAMDTTHDYAGVGTPAVWRGRTSSAGSIDSLSVDDFPDFEIPAFLRKEATCAEKSGNKTPLEILKAFDEMAQLSGAEGWFGDRLDAIGAPQALADQVDALAVDLGSRSLAWATVIQWLADGLAGELTLSRLGSRILRHSLKPVDGATLKRLTMRLTEKFGGLQAANWSANTASV